MGADLILAYVPAFEANDARREEIKEVIGGLAESDFDDNDWWDEDDLEQNKKTILKFVEDACIYLRDCDTIKLDGALPHWISGGLSWGESPCDSYNVLSLVVSCDKVFNLFSKYSTEDAAKIER